MCEHRSDENEAALKWKNIAENLNEELNRLTEDVTVYRTRNVLFEKAINKWGRQSQIDMMIEECAELIKALCKLKRAHHPSDTASLVNDICEEIADVQLMLNQMKIVFSEKEVRDWYNVKVERLQNLLNR